MSDVLATNLMWTELLFFPQIFYTFRMTLTYLRFIFMFFTVSLISFSTSCVLNGNRSEL